ncbi:hypothetical protein HPP92_012922 [Vanilla planifolia]|uniref:Uncharacterized protein n=1 Tax=Vanilla planifolia TaxID=51239 RepID=A0A835R1F7_VANPL|nr:hypothetical protein HPP92_012922 [Vanilla planifolia]
MGLVRSPSLRGEEYLEGIITDYVNGKGTKVRTAKRSTPHIVAALTCLQLGFAIYATFLLYYMSPAVDLRSKPDFSWASQIAQQWKNFLVQPRMLSHVQENPSTESPGEVCEHQQIDFEQKKSNDEVMIRFKRELYDEILEFQSKNLGSETLAELMRLKSHWSKNGPNIPKTLPFNHVWVLSFGSPNELSLKKIVESYNNSKISFVSSSYDFKYYGRFQMALQTESDFVYIVDDDMIPGRKMLEILAHVGGTEKYRNAVLGSIGRILPLGRRILLFQATERSGRRRPAFICPILLMISTCTEQCKLISCQAPGSYLLILSRHYLLRLLSLS